MEVLEMTEKEQIAILIDQYTDLQRIKAAADKEKEVEYQIRTTKAKLEAMGIVTEDLNIQDTQGGRACHRSPHGKNSIEVKIKQHRTHPGKGGNYVIFNWRNGRRKRNYIEGMEVDTTLMFSGNLK